MTTRISAAAATARRNAAADAIADLLDAGPAAGYLVIRTGAQPATVATGATGTVLATVTLDDPALGPAVNGTAEAFDLAPVVATGTGLAGWFRAFDSAGVAVIDGAVGAELILTDPDIVTGGTVTIEELSISQPA